MSDIGEWAKWYATALGWPVFPCWGITPDKRCQCGKADCASPGKHPIPANGFKAATTEPEKIRAFWEEHPSANIGIPTGMFAVVDVDPRNGGEDPPDMPRTPKVATGGGGWHHYVKLPQQPIGKLGKGVDVQLRGKYVIAPPSTHVSGNRYSWLVEPTIALAPFPEGLAPVRPKRTFSTAAEARLAFVLPERIHAGERNNTLTRYAGQLRGQGADVDEIEKALIRAYTRCCDHKPPMNSQELRNIAESIGSRPLPEGVAENPLEPLVTADVSPEGPTNPPVTNDGRPGDEQGLCERIIDELSEVTAPITDLGALWAYADNRWCEFDWNAVAQLFKRWADDGLVIGKRRFRVRGTTVDACYKLTKGFTTQKDFFAEAPNLVAFANGVIDTEGSLHTHSPEHRVRWIRDYDYEPEAQCPLWLSVLDRSIADHEKIAILQEFAGAALLGMAPRYEKALILNQMGGDGKSVIAGAIASLFPRDAVVSVAPHNMPSDYHRAVLAKALLNYVDDLPRNELSETGDLKAIISGKPISVRQPYEKVLTLRSAAAHVYCTNSLPAMSDFSRGFNRRWIILDFSPTAALKDAEMDVSLPEKLLAERPGIAAWAIQGARRLHAQGHYTESADADSAKASWILENDQVAEFIEDMLVQGSEVRTPLDTLYMHYTVWAARVGRKPLHRTHLGTRLTQARIQPYRTMTERGYVCEIKKKTR